MQWTFTCVLLASCAVISASDHGVRSKRDLSFIKRYFMSKILGHHAANMTKIVNPSENYRLFGIPGHDKILVKAVPKVPVVLDTEATYPAISEVIETESVPVHPSIAIVSKYLGTSQLNDTLFALKGVKNLLQSGVLTAQRKGIDQISSFKEELLQPVLVEPSNIAVGYNKRPVMVYPTLGETLIGKITPGHRYPNIKVPTHYSYKQVNKGGVTSYTAHDSQNVLVTEIKRPVPLPAPVNHRIWEILSLGSYRLPTSPVVRPVIGMEKVKLPPVEMVPGYHSNHLYHDGSGAMHSAQMVLQVEDDTPVVIEKVTKPLVSKEEGVYKVHGSTHKVKLPSHSSGYSYNQVHNDGSVTMYSGSGKVVEHEGEKSTIVMTEPGRPTLVVPGVERPPAPIPVYNLPKIKAGGSSAGYSYNHVHNDGSKTAYFGSGHVVENKVERPAIVITEPGRPTVFVPDVDRPAFIPVYNRHTVQGSTGSGFSYNQVHNDGSVTTYSGSGKVVEHVGENPAMVITEHGRPTVVVADVKRQPAPIPVYNLPKVETPSSSGYSYSHVHNDGSMTTYAGSGHVVEHVGKNPAMVITEPGRPTVVVADMKRPPAPIPVYNVPKVKIPSGSGYSYNHVHNDGFVTTYLGSGHVKHVGEKPAMVITEPGRPTVVMADFEGPPAPIPVYNLPKVKVPSNSGYAYSHVHNDGLITTYAGSGHTVEHLGVQPPVVITEPGRPTVVVADVKGPPAPIPAYNLPKVEAPSSSGYSYSHVHNDGSMTTYAGSGHVVEHERERQPVVITEPGRPTVVVADVKGPPAPIPAYNLPKVEAPSGSGYSYSHVHNDGSMTTYAGSGHVVEHEGEMPPVVITEPGRPTVVVADVERPPVMIPVYNSPKVKAPSGSGYSYSHVHNDGSMTKYNGSGYVVEHEGERPPVVITEPGRPTVVVPDVKGPPAPIPTYNLPKVEAPSSSGYSYSHVHNDGSMTTYAGSGHVVQHEGEMPPVVITEPGRPTVVVADVERPPVMVPVYNSPKVKAPSGSGYSYSHVHNGGSMTTYNGSGHVVEHEGERPPVVITEPGRPTVVVADVERPPVMVPVYNSPKVKAPSGSGYSYSHVHNDGSMTTYNGSGHVVEHEGERPPVVITEPGRPTVVVDDVERPPVMVPVYNSPKVKAPSGSGFSYDHVHNDGSVTTYSGLGQVVEHEEKQSGVVISAYGKPTVVMAGAEGLPAPMPDYNLPNAPSGSGYTYNHVHNDGFMTTYSGSGRVDHVGEKPAMVITEPGRPTVVVADVEGPPAPIPAYNLPKVKAPSGSGFFYNHVHNDGSVTTYSGSGNVVEHEGERPPVVITEPGRPTVVVADVEGPSAPMPVYNLPKAPSGSGYFYDHVRNDGLITTYTGSGKVNEHRGERPAAVITEPGRPTVVVSGVDGHAAPIPVYNAPKAQTGYSYSHMNNDAFMKNNYDQVNTLIVEERPEHMYKYEHVRNSYEMPQRPHIREQVKVNVNSQNENSRPSPSSHTGFSYKTVHEDGSVTDYSDVKVTEGAKLDRPMLYPTGPETHQYDKGHSAVAEKCKNRTRGGVSKNCKSHSVAVSSNSSHYSYKTVSQDGSTSYSGSGHVQVESAKFDTAAHDKEVSSSIVNAPLLVTQTDDDNPQKVTLTPILSKFSYKQVNNHKPDDFQDEKVNKVVSAINRTSELQSIDVSEAPKDVYVTPPEVNEPVPIKKPVDETINTTKKTVAVPYTTRKSVAVSTSTKSSHFKPKRVYRKRVRTSTSRSSLRTSVPETTTPQESSSTAVTTEGSLSANPIVVLPEEDKVFSFKQERSDGSSITVVGDKDNKVSAVLEESKTSLNRGDIPESSF